MNKLIPWTLAAGFALLAIWIGQLYMTVRAQARSLEGEKTLLELQVQSARNQLEAERIVNQREIADLRRELAEGPRK